MIAHAPSATDIAWQEAWKEEIRRRARVEIPQLLRSVRTQRLKPLTTAAVAAPATPIPVSPDTGEMERIRETVMIPAVRLLKPVIDVRDTRELVSSAVKRFWEKHHCLPSVIALNPMRCLTIVAPDYFPLDDECAALGCYAVSVISAPQIGCDTVLLWGTCYINWGGIGDYYL